MTKKLETIRVFLLGALFLFILPELASGQDDLNIHGVVSDAMSSSKLSDVEVTVMKDGSKYDTFNTRGNGKYEFYLDIGARYELIFKKSGYVDRSIVIDSKGVPEEVVGAGIIMPTDMSMYAMTEAMEGADLSVFNQPIGKAAYDAAQADLVWDFNYTNQVKSEIFAFIRDMEKKQKELDKEASAEEKAAQEKEAKFQEFVKKGDEALSADDYEDAVLNYKAALDLKPGDPAVQAKLGDAQTKLNQKKSAEKLEADYTAALDAGDGFMRTEEYDKAIEQYQQALKLKPGESYPKTQIEEANRIKEERAAEMARQEKFNKLMAEADGLVADKSYAEAIKKYDEALTVIPKNNEAERKKSDAQKALDALKEAEAKKEEYTALITAADAAFAKSEYEAAKSKYQEASDLLPDESYPKDRIAACESKLSELAAAAEKQAEFNKLMAEGNEALTAAKYEDAIEKFESALVVFPKNADATAKLNEAKGLLAELTAEQEKLENYNALIAEGDDAFKNEDYASAREKYTAARDLMPNEEYPKTKLAEINSLLADLAEEQKKQEAYDAAMAAGNKAFEGEKYTEAIAKYQEALSVYPDDKNASDALTNAQSALEEFQANKQKREEYDALIASADKKFDAGTYETAKSDYAAALGIYPEEVYPSDRISEIENRLAQAEKQAEFDALVAEGDKSVKAENYDAAITSYQEALALIESAEVEQKIEDAEARKKALEELKSINERYDQLIADADAAFAEKNWTEARAQYEKALELKDKESYPSDQLKVIEEELAAEMAALQAKFDAEIAKGDAKVEANLFGDAISLYEAARSIIDDPLVDEKIAAAEAKKKEFEAQQSVDEQYNMAIEEADAFYSGKDWNKAIASYEKAAGIKPKEEYPGSQIALIEAEKAAELAARREEEQAQFDALVASGDKKVKDKLFDDAISDYREALTILESPEVEQKISEAEKQKLAFQDKQALDAQYQEAISAGDAAFKEKNWASAKASYELALSLKSDENYPKDQLALIEENIAAEEEALASRELAEKNTRVNALVAQGDEKMKTSAFAEAVEKYEEALAILPDREDVKEKLSQAENALLAKQEKMATEEAYLEALANADKDFEKANWEEALSAYEEASSIKPDQSYPREKIEEVKLKMEAQAEAERLKREAELRSQFDDLIKEGDKQFNKRKYDKALTEYEAALALLPENEVAQAKVAAAREALGELEADEQKIQEYENAIAEGDELFKEESYEMAKLKYMDASEIMPEQQYPQKKIREIEILLEKQRLNALAQEQAEIDKRYRESIDAGDQAMSSRSYDAAIQSYTEALEIKPGEAYPQSQIERIALLKKEEEEAKRERDRLAAQRDNRESENRTGREDYNRVNTDSERQAEQFMREAREAQQNERYERIKKLKALDAENKQAYAMTSEQLRENNYRSLEVYRASFEEQFKEVVALREERKQNSQQYKKSLLANQRKLSELDEVRNSDQLSEIDNLFAEVRDWHQEKSKAQEVLIKRQAEIRVEQLAQMEEWSTKSYNEKIEANLEKQEAAAKLYAENQRAEELRKARAQSALEEGDEYETYLAELNSNSLVKSKERKKEIEARKEKQSDAMAVKEDKMRENAAGLLEEKERYNQADEENRKLAQARMEEAQKELKSLETSTRRKYDDYYRSELAENYPQGVTEESSTLGNKVIITRIVVKGNKGDEYKKVVDKAGKYYFKNGQSISEYTWNRETIDAFRKSKD